MYREVHACAKIPHARAFHLYACAVNIFALINFSRANGSELNTQFSKANFVLLSLKMLTFVVLKLQKFDRCPFEASKVGFEL